MTVCPDCGNQITESPSVDGREYGHAADEHGEGRCPRRPRGVDPTDARGDGR